MFRESSLTDGKRLMVPEFIALLTVSYRVFRETPGNIRMHTGAFPSPVVNIEMVLHIEPAVIPVVLLFTREKTLSFLIPLSNKISPGLKNRESTRFAS